MIDTFKSVIDALSTPTVSFTLLTIFIPLVFPPTDLFDKINRKFGIWRLWTKPGLIGGMGFITFFFIGIYGGFIQAGVGYLIIASMSFIHNYGMVKINMIKSLTVLIYTLSALGVFIYSGLINWELGLALAAGNGAGGWLPSRWSTKVNEKYIRYFVMVTAIAFAIKLFFG